MAIRVGLLALEPAPVQTRLLQRLSGNAELNVVAFYCLPPVPVPLPSPRRNQPPPVHPLLEGHASVLLKNVSRTPGTSAFKGCDTPELSAQIAERQFDAFVVPGWNTKSELQAVWGCRRMGIPCLLRSVANGLQPRPWWRMWLLRQFVRQYQAYLVTGQRNAEFLQQLGAGSEKFFPAPACVDHELLRQQADAAAPQRTAIRKKWEIPPDAVTFLFHGDLTPANSPLDVLQAFIAARRTNPRLHLLLLGTGELQEACSKLIWEQTLPVTLGSAIKVDELPLAYAAADGFVCPATDRDPWGFTVQEAMARGLPAMISDQVGCAPDLILENITGSIFRKGDWSQLSEQMVRWASSPTGLRNAGIAARKQVERYSVEAAAEGIAEAVRAVQRKRKKPAPVQADSSAT